MTIIEFFLTLLQGIPNLEVGNPREINDLNIKAVLKFPGPGIRS